MYAIGDLVYVFLNGRSFFGFVKAVRIPLYHPYGVQEIGKENGYGHNGLSGKTFQRAAITFGGPCRAEELPDVRSR